MQLALPFTFRPSPHILQLVARGSFTDGTYIYTLIFGLWTNVYQREGCGHTGTVDPVLQFSTLLVTVEHMIFVSYKALN